jgi:hypothetical protein
MKSSLKKSKSGKERKMTKERPCPKRPLIHAVMPVSSTHTHGSTELGMPEIIMCPMIVGTAKTNILVDACYDYFSKPGNKSMLDSIKYGNTVKLTLNDLHPELFKKGDDNYVYGLTRIYPDHPIVEETYSKKELKKLSPNAWFVQIHLDSDNLASTVEHKYSQYCLRR